MVKGFQQQDRPVAEDYQQQPHSSNDITSPIFNTCYNEHHRTECSCPWEGATSEVLHMFTEPSIRVRAAKASNTCWQFQGHIQDSVMRNAVPDHAQTPKSRGRSSSAVRSATRCDSSAETQKSCRCPSSAMTWPQCAAPLHASLTSAACSKIWYIFALTYTNNDNSTTTP